MAETSTSRFDGHWWKDRAGQWHRFDVPAQVEVPAEGGGRFEDREARSGRGDDDSTKAPFPGWFKASDGRWRPPTSATRPAEPLDAATWPRRAATEPPS